ncbi:MAG: SulP family inorganic anion transporter [Pirellulales bacterium]
MESKHYLWRKFPAFDALRTYSVGHFRRDLVAGITVAAVAVPQAMAYATIFGVPPEYGLYTAIVMTAVGAIFDSSRQLINGPTNAISIALLSALGSVDGQNRIEAAMMMATLIGLIQVGITLFRLGDLSRYVSHAVIVGFTLGASVLLVLDQLKNVFGLQAKGDPHDHFLSRLWQTWTEGGRIHWPTVGVAVGTIVLVLVLRQIRHRWKLAMPELLTALVVMSAVVAYWDLAGTQGVKLIPEIPRSLPHFQVPTYDFALMRQLAGSATAIALLGLLEAIAMAKSIAARTGEKLDINQQCLSEGLANLAGSFFRCFPGSGSLTRSFINHQAGAATQWSGVISALGVAATILLAAPYAQYIPRAALAGILIFSALRMVDQHQLTYHLRATRFDALIVLSTALSAVLVSVEFCILIGVLMSFMFYVPRAARTEMSVLTLAPGNVVRPRLADDPLCSRLRIYNLEGEWFFGSAPDVERLLEQIEAETVGTVRTVLLRVKHVRNADGVCMHLFDEFLQRMARGGTRVVLCGVRDDFLKVLRDSGVAARLPAECVYPETSQVWTSTMLAIQDAYEQLGDDLCSHCPRLGAAGPEPSGWYYSI